MKKLLQINLIEMVFFVFSFLSDSINLSLTTIVLIAFLISCKKPDADPQTKDYIYIDLKQKLADKEALKITNSTALHDLEMKLADEDSQSIQKKVLRRKISIAKWEIAKIDQIINYYKIKIVEREKFVRKRYISSFEKDETWNNSEEIERYKKSQASLSTKNHKNEIKKEVSNEGKSEEPPATSSH